MGPKPPSSQPAAFGESRLPANPTAPVRASLSRLFRRRPHRACWKPAAWPRAHDLGAAPAGPGWRSARLDQRRCFHVEPTQPVRSKLARPAVDRAAARIAPSESVDVQQVAREVVRVRHLQAPLHGRSARHAVLQPHTGTFPFPHMPVDYGQRTARFPFVSARPLTAKQQIARPHVALTARPWPA